MIRQDFRWKRHIHSKEAPIRLGWDRSVLQWEKITMYTVVANKTGPTRVADFRAVFTAERPYLFLGPETTYAVEQ